MKNGHVLLDRAGDVGSDLSVRRAEGICAIPVAYYDDSNNRLKSVRCDHISCSAPATPAMVDDPGKDLGQFVRRQNASRQWVHQRFGWLGSCRHQRSIAA